MTDPKPNLNKATILANIEYYQNLQEWHRQQLNYYLKKEQEWIDELENVVIAANNGESPAL